MSTWNYRIVRHEDELAGGEDWYAIHEVYYDENGKPNNVTETPIELSGESVEDLHTDFELIRKAFDNDVLDWKLFEIESDEEKIYDPFDTEDLTLPKDFSLSDFAYNTPKKSLISKLKFWKNNK